jgi:hypothetical protein
MHLSILLLALLPSPAPSVRTGDFEKVTEERLRAAYADARAALESELGARFAEGLVLRIATAEEVGKRVAEENLPQLRRSQPDEEKARAQARLLGEATGQFAYAKYSWSAREFLVVPRTWERNARQLERPVLTEDAALRAVMVHELVHAWDDHVHDLTAFVDRSDSIDAASAINAIVEGHAQHVARRVCKARGWSAGFDAFTAVIGAIPESSKSLGEAMLMVQRAQAANLSFAYRDGESFVDALERAGGAEALARAFREPPRDGETILHPEWYLDPKTRPPSLYDPEPALDLFVKRFPAEVWTSQRISLQSNQMEAALALLPKEESRAILASIRNARLVVLNPTANPGEKVVILSVMEFGTAAEARAWVEASGRLSKLKDEQMKTGVVRITGSSTSTIESDDAARTAGLLQTKQMKNGALAFEVKSIDLARGKVVVETLFSGEPIETDPHVKLAIELLDAVKMREPK